MNVQQLMSLIQQPESEWLEFKKDNTDFEQIGRNMAAISNALPLQAKPRQRGYIIWGVDNQNRQIVGTGFDPKSSKRGNEELENWLLRLLQPRINFYIHTLQVENKNVAVIEVYAATHQPTSFSGARYIRVGSYTKNLNDYPEKERALWAYFSATPFDQGLAFESATPEQVLEFIDYTTCFKKLGQALPTDRQGILDLLEQNRIIQARNSSGLYDISNPGAVLFCNDFKYFNRLVRKAVRVIVYNGNNRTCNTKEKPFDAGYIVEFENIIEYIDDQIEKTEKIVKALREEFAAYPILAIRELVANAILHQDFLRQGPGGPMVELFTNRIEISNAGEPLIDVLRFVDKAPEPRNEKMVRFARYMRISEDRGMGIDKVITVAEEQHLAPPEFRALDGATKVILLPQKEFTALSADERMRACYQHACLRYLSHDELTNASLRARFNLKDTKHSLVSKVIQNTVAQGLIKNKHSKGKVQYYVPFWA